MLYRARKGQTSYGEPIGILLLDTFTPFIPGDVGNASSYPFPVRFHKVEGFTVRKALAGDRSVYEPLLQAARDLEAQGVRAVTGDCGFMALHQEALAEELSVPVFLSSLLQLRFIFSLLDGKGKVAVFTADSGSLDQALLDRLGIEDAGRLVICGLQDEPRFREAILEEKGVLDAAGIEQEVVARAHQAMETHPEVEAVLLECSCLPPYGHAVREATGLPVFDYFTMIHYVYTAVVRQPFSGIM